MLVTIKFEDPTHAEFLALANALCPKAESQWSDGDTTGSLALQDGTRVDAVNYWRLLQWLLSHSDQAPRIFAAFQKFLEAQGIAAKFAALIELAQIIKELLGDLPTSAPMQAPAPADIAREVRYAEERAAGLFGGGDGTKIRKLFEFFKKYLPFFLELIGGLQ